MKYMIPDSLRLGTDTERQLEKLDELEDIYIAEHRLKNPGLRLSMKDIEMICDHCK